MNKKFFAIIFIIIVNNGVFAQIKSKYARGFEIGFAEGYCYNRETVDCFRPITPLSPLPRLNENKENYNQGYNRGFQYGLDLKRSSNAKNVADVNLNQRIIKFNNYVSQNPVNAMAYVGMMKQAKYDARKDWIQERIDILNDLLYELFNPWNLPNGTDFLSIRKTYWGNTVQYVNSIRGYDFADDYQFNSIISNFNNIERTYYDNYNYLVKQHHKIEAENNISEKTNLQFENFFSSSQIGRVLKFEVYELEKDLDNTYKPKSETHQSNVVVNKEKISFTLKNGVSRDRIFTSTKYDKENNRFICYTDYGIIIIMPNLESIIFYNGSILSHRYVLIKNN